MPTEHNNQEITSMTQSLYDTALSINCLSFIQRAINGIAECWTFFIENSSEEKEGVRQLASIVSMKILLLVSICKQLKTEEWKRVTERTDLSGLVQENFIALNRLQIAENEEVAKKKNMCKNMIRVLSVILVKGFAEKNPSYHPLTHMPKITDGETKLEKYIVNPEEIIAW